MAIINDPADPLKAEVRIRGTAPHQVLDFYIPKGSKGDKGDQGAPNALTVLGTTTGPETAGATGPQGPQGLKGDPGGIVLGTLLGTSDLNDIRVSGIYRQITNTDATLARNYPVASQNGVLTVHEHSVSPNQAVTQTYEPVWGTPQGRVFYTRTMTTGGWMAWRAFSATRVDQTAGRTIYQWDDVNNREQLIYGDTGWRNVRSLFESVASANGITFNTIAGFTDPAIRRVGSTIYYRIGVSLTGWTGQGLVDWRTALQPTGFKTDQIDNWQIPASVTGSAGTIHWSPINYIRFWTPGNQVFVQTLSTSDPWPTTLPGVALGTIPNA